MTQLFTSTFGSSEGEDEGALVGGLVTKLSANINDCEIFCFGSFENQQIIGAIFFTKLQFKDGAFIYMLAPVAVSTEHQKSGVGKALINFGLTTLASLGTAVVVTYGDLGYYGKFGFKPLSENMLKAPMPLSMPHGWLGLPMTENPIQARADQSTCVEAFHNPAYW